jgi:penicillin-binding protein 1A
MVGGKDWNASKVNLAVGAAGGGAGRQAGSAFKPFVLAETLHEGYTAESSFLGPAAITLPHADRGNDWKVSNFEEESFGRLNLIDATEHSVNTVYAQLVTAIGPENVVSMAHSAGIKSKLDPVPSITLGTQNVSVMEMADSYLTFANEGTETDPQVFSKITDASGAVLYDGKPQRKRVLPRDQADVMNFTLSQVVEHGTGTGAKFGKPVAGKTGTTEDFGDAWFVGYTPKLSTAVWMGYTQGQSRQMTDVHGMKVNGGSLPATIFSRFMTKATKDPTYDSDAEFPKPATFPGKVLGARVAFVQQETTSSVVAPPPTAKATTATTVARAATPTSVAVAPKPTQPAPKPTTPPPTSPSPPPTNPKYCQVKPEDCQPP